MQKSYHTFCFVTNWKSSHLWEVKVLWFEWNKANWIKLLGKAMKFNQDIRKMIFTICYFQTLACLSKTIFALCGRFLTVQSSTLDIMALSICRRFISQIRNKVHQRMEIPPLHWMKILEFSVFCFHSAFYL